MRLIPVAMLALLLLGAAPPDRATARDIERAYKICQKGERALKLGNLEQARRQFARALDIVPDFGVAHLGSGHVLMQERRFEQALEAYETALRGYRTMGEQLLAIEADRYASSRERISRLQDEILYLGNMMPHMRKPQLVQQARARMLGLENEIRRLEAMSMPRPESAHEPPARIHFFIGNALVNLDRTDEAIEAYRACAKKSPSFALAHHNLAISYWKAGRLDNARMSLARAEELGLPVHPELKAHVSPGRP